MNDNQITPAQHHIAQIRFNVLPEQDGVDHINIYSRGATFLGRRLSHFAYIPFSHPQHGDFSSMEGFWHWMRNGRTDDTLRQLSGMAAKAHGRKGNSFMYPHFRDEIMGANYQKIIQTPHLHEEFVSSTLPFTHYYLMGSEGNFEMRTGSGSDWLVDGMETIRQELKANEIPQVWLRCQKRYEELGGNIPSPPTIPSLLGAPPTCSKTNKSTCSIVQPKTRR
jgi:hypothetical protein